MTARRFLFLLATATALLALATGIAVAHVERSSYWPNPAPDTAVKPAAGGKVPKARGLASALRRRARGDTYVVCKSNSLRRATRSIRSARRKGWKVRPTARTRKLSRKAARRLTRINRRLSNRCRFRHIQRAVNRAGNNDRVVVMPGVYLEEPSRRKPTNDPKCAQYEEESENGAGAATYRYQVECPNDQNLIFVQGRALTDTPVPFPPRADRRGIPDEGRCVRCNLQIEGSGVKAEDVVVDLAKNPRAAKLRGPAAPLKEVGIRADRADGLVVRNMTFAHSKEHGIYVHETDGYLLARVKLFYNQDYGTLTFTSDHGVTKDCEAMGSGDAGVYPGAAPETGEQTAEGARRANQLITRCDVHHNNIGYSGTMGNGTRVVNNNFYDNATGITTDSFFAGGHPGYPQDGAVFENNNIYSNNFNTFEEGSDVEPRVPVPVGTGIFIAGGNGNEIRGNRIWDNWRRGTMLIYVPDSLSGQPAGGPQDSTAHRNRYHDNVMGMALGGARLPNGVDFWWDEAPNQRNNCWFGNGDVTTDPPAPLMPESCENTSAGVTYGPKLNGELLPCAGSIESDNYDPNTCPWFRTPPKPSGSSQGSQGGLPLPLAAASSSRVSPRLTAPLSDFCTRTGTTLSCAPFRDRL